MRPPLLISLRSARSDMRMPRHSPTAVTSPAAVEAEVEKQAFRRDLGTVAREWLRVPEHS
ncbi:hypothetical protein ACOBQX_08475 [Actinokineospora sp. G85]|uniref:hypothetical protein n=1 Tax=Actinokineospora sp. G85 TaxID=3406626 RepID=UPI003C724888